MFKIEYQFINLSIATILVTIINAALLVLLGETLKENRTRCKMTQEFVAQALGVTRQAVSKWEKGASEPNTSNLLALARLYNISLQELTQTIDN